MILEKEMAIIEAILFLENEPVEARSLARISGLAQDVVELALEALREQYSSPGHGVELVEFHDAFMFAPKKELWEHLRDRYGKRNDQKLSKAAMETLSIIAYSQPITRPEVDSIRGVGSDNSIRLLLARGLIQEVGKKDAPGRPSQYGTTREFLKMFRLSSIAELPKLGEVEREKFELN